VFFCVSLRADAEGQHLLGHDMAGRWKAESLQLTSMQLSEK